MHRRVGVLMGGPSYERDISIKSGRAVCSALHNKNIEVVPIELEKKSVSLSEYKEIVKQRLCPSKIDVAFISLHGTFGEDGTVQEILEELRIPYTGSRVMASRLGMDKISSKRIFKEKNISVPEYIVIDNINKCDDNNLIKDEFPVVVKPYDTGSSIGLAIVDNEDDLDLAINTAFQYSDKLIVERYIKGRELTIGILEDRALSIIEIIPKRRFFDFSAKYLPGFTEYVVPADISEEQAELCKRTAVIAHKSLGAFFFSRVDMILSDKGIPMVLEVNTIPGLTEMSLLPKAAKSEGIDYETLVLKILESATL